MEILIFLKLKCKFIDGIWWNSKSNSLITKTKNSNSNSLFLRPRNSNSISFSSKTINSNSNSFMWRRTNSKSKSKLFFQTLVARYPGRRGRPNRAGGSEGALQWRVRWYLHPPSTSQESRKSEMRTTMTPKRKHADEHRVHGLRHLQH